MSRVAIFMDGSNFGRLLEQYCADNDFPWSIDYQYLQEDLLRGRRHVGTHYYNSIVPPYKSRKGGTPAKARKTFREKKRLFEKLRGLGFCLHIEEIDTTTRRYHKCSKCGHLHPPPGNQRGNLKEKMTDSSLILDMLKMAQEGKYDVAVLVSSDGDFAWAASVVKSMGLEVEWVTFAHYGVSKLLREVCGEPTRMGPVIEKQRVWE